MDMKLFKYNSRVLTCTEEDHITKCMYHRLIKHCTYQEEITINQIFGTHVQFHRTTRVHCSESLEFCRHIVCSSLYIKKLFVNTIHINIEKLYSVKYTVFLWRMSILYEIKIPHTMFFIEPLDNLIVKQHNAAVNKSPHRSPEAEFQLNYVFFLAFSLLHVSSFERAFP